MKRAPSPNEVPFTKIKWIDETENDYIGRCPFCGDSIKNVYHGHLYVSKRYPIYHCYRCGSKGFLSAIEKILNESCKKEYTLSVKYDMPILNIPQILSETYDLLRMYSLFITDVEKEYFRVRTRLKSITDNNIIKFSLFPDYYARAYLYESIIKNLKCDGYRTWTLRGFSTGLSGRAHENSYLRYVNGDLTLPWNQYIQADTYFIRSYPIINFSKVSRPNILVIAEGIYDIVPLYLYRSKYSIDDKDAVFMAAQCSSYDRCVTVYKMLYNCMPNIIIIFADVGIGIDKLRKQFSSYVSKDRKIVVNWPIYKDWAEAGAIKQSITL